VFRLSPKASLTLCVASFFIVAVVNVGVSHNYVNGEKCKEIGTKHGDNKPSEKQLKHMASSGSLCEIAQCVDSSKCSNHDSLDIKKFKESPAYTQASEEQQKCIDKAAKHGHGMDGLGGYEVMYCNWDKS
jgi:hypothetical protein